MIPVQLWESAYKKRHREERATEGRETNSRKEKRPFDEGAVIEWRSRRALSRLLRGIGGD